MKRVRSDDDDILLASSSGGAVSVSRALAIEHSVTIANFLKDVPDATEFVIPDCEGMTLLWIEHAMEVYPERTNDPTDIVNAVCVANYLHAEKLLDIAVKRLYLTGLWRLEAAKSIPADVMLHKVYPLVSSWALISTRKTNPLVATYILRKSKAKFAFPAKTDDETYIEAWKELKDNHPMCNFSDYFLPKAAVASDVKTIITAAVEKYGSFATIYALREKRAQTVKMRLEYERELVFKNGYRDVKFSEALRNGKSEARWKTAAKTAILKHAEKISDFMKKKNYTYVYKMVTDQKFKDLINETF